MPPVITAVQPLFQPLSGRASTSRKPQSAGIFEAAELTLAGTGELLLQSLSRELAAVVGGRLA